MSPTTIKRQRQVSPEHHQQRKQPRRVHDTPSDPMLTPESSVSAAANASPDSLNGSPSSSASSPSVPSPNQNGQKAYGMPAMPMAGFMMQPPLPAVIRPQKNERLPAVSFDAFTQPSTLPPTPALSPDQNQTFAIPSTSKAQFDVYRSPQAYPSPAASLNPLTSPYNLSPAQPDSTNGSGSSYRGSHDGLFPAFAQTIGGLGIDASMAPPTPIDPSVPSYAPSQIAHWQLSTPPSPTRPHHHETRRGIDIGLGLEDFEPGNILGTGTFGSVLLTRLLRPVLPNTPTHFAMKVLAKKEVVRLKQVQHINSERLLLASVRHSGIVNLFCTFQDERNLYLVLEFVQGGELFSHLRRAGRFSADVSRFYAANILLALEYMHSRDIVYRDLKPENLLLDPQGYIKITDFGFAKIVHDRTFTTCGTPEYLSPEIIQSQGHGKPADYWAFGVLLFELLCGFPAFWADSPLAIYEKILAGNLVFPNHVDSIARDLIRRLLSANLSKRLGNLHGGIRDIMNHAWFEGVDWYAVQRREIPAPIIPRSRGPADSSHFEHYPDFDLANLPAIARAVYRRQQIQAGTWREPTEAEQAAAYRQQEAADTYRHFFEDF